jgi:GNAT superfamily N-acetyltransferase
VDGVLDSALGEDLQAEVIRTEYAGMQAPYVCGATIWCWADHPWPEEDFIKYLTTSPFGVVTRTRRRKRAYATVRELFALPYEEEQHHEHDSDNVSVTMLRPNLDGIPRFALPEGYSIRTMRLGESTIWTDIHRDSEPFFGIADGLFESEFGDDMPATQRRTYFIVNARGSAVGTISAWYSRDFRGEDWGRLHWFTIRPAYRGSGLARPAITHCLEQMAQWHDKVWLSTSTGRLPALKLYLDFGFLPDLSEPGAREAWARVQEKLHHPLLGQALHGEQPGS